MQSANTLVLISAALVGLLGAAHLLITLRGPKLLPRDPSLKPAMERVSPKITRQTTMWRAWMGFNFSHSMGALLFGLVYGYLALFQGALLFQTVFLQALGLVTLVSYVALARLYWFVTPLIGTSLALLCYLAGMGLAHA